MPQEFAIISNLAVGLTAALVLGFVTFKLKLSPTVGYLLAGIAIGPQTPGLLADQATASQFADIGVILLMFGVGLNFDLRDLLAVRHVAVPGVLLGQVPLTTVVAAAVVAWSGWGWVAAIVVGLCLSVTSTVVMIRVLANNGVLETEQGHIAIGWSIVEDLFTVFVLVMMPALAGALAARGGGGTLAVVESVLIAALKIFALGVIVLWAGRKVIPRILQQVARTRMRELFTLTILVVALVIAAGSTFVFGVSMALGAFMAGMVVGQSEVSHQAAADALPMRDAFAVLFFVSVGMLFDPFAIPENPLLFCLLLGVILLIKPLGGLAMVWLLGHSVRTALTVAFALGQIGEFSFILAELAVDLDILPPLGQSLLVACSIVSMALNPLIFRGAEPMERWLRSRPRLWGALSRRAEARAQRLPEQLALETSQHPDRKYALIVGYGPVGRTAATILRDFEFEPVVVDLNIDTVRSVSAAGGLAIFGDASHRDILEAAGIRGARYLLITIPDLATRTVIVLAARELNPQLKVFVRARYLQERAWLEEIGVSDVCYEEAEAAIGLAAQLLREVGADEQRISDEQRKIRDQWALHPDLPCPPPEARGDPLQRVKQLGPGETG
jgi:CPA2 family monovalent cation:H+ antiporter-2